MPGSPSPLPKTLRIEAPTLAMVGDSVFARVVVPKPESAKAFEAGSSIVHQLAVPEAPTENLEQFLSRFTKALEAGARELDTPEEIDEVLPNHALVGIAHDLSQQVRLGGWNQSLISEQKVREVLSSLLIDEIQRLSYRWSEHDGPGASVVAAKADTFGAVGVQLPERGAALRLTAGTLRNPDPSAVNMVDVEFAAAVASGLIGMVDQVVTVDQFVERVSKALARSRLKLADSEVSEVMPRDRLERFAEELAASVTLVGKLDVVGDEGAARSALAQALRVEIASLAERGFDPTAISQ